MAINYDLYTLYKLLHSRSLVVEDCDSQYPMDNSSPFGAVSGLMVCLMHRHFQIFGYLVRPALGAAIANTTLKL